MKLLSKIAGFSTKHHKTLFNNEELVDTFEVSHTIFDDPRTRLRMYRPFSLAGLGVGIRIVLTVALAGRTAF